MSERIRVLRVIARMNVGGPALQVTGLIEGMNPLAFDHVVVTGRVEEGEADYISLRAPDAPVRYLDGLGRSIRPGDDFRALVALVRLMREFRPHIVHTHTAKAGVLGRTAARLARVPHTVHTFHGHLLHGYFGRAGTAAITAVERLLARGTDRLLAVGSQVRDDLLAVGIGCREQYLVVPPGVRLPPVPSREEARSQLNLPVAGLVVAFVARLTDIKRPDRFVRVARSVNHTHPEVVFAVAGDGPLLSDMRQQAESLGEAITFLGFRGDVETVYAAADVVVLTSDNEGMPVSLIEASLVGRPCVTTDVGSASEVVIHGETGYVVPKAVEELAKAVEHLLDDPDTRVRMGLAAQRHAEAHFSRGRLVRDMERLYKELAGGGPA